MNHDHTHRADDAGADSQRGIVFICDGSDRIVKVLVDELEVGSSIRDARSCAELLEAGSLAKWLNFLEEVRDRTVVFGWVINMRIRNRPWTLHCAGAVHDEGVLIVAAGTRQMATALYREMDVQGMFREQSYTVRNTARDDMETERLLQEKDSALYDEISRLNSELVTVQRELAQKNVELRKINDQKNQFMGIAAHDLRTPIGTTMAYTELLLEDSRRALNEDQKEILHDIYSSNAYMLDLLDDLLDYAKIEAGQVQLNRQLSDMSVLAENVVKLNRVVANGKGISICLDNADRTETDRLCADIDRLRIEQVLNNLITNAVKFSRRGSSITVAVDRINDDIEIQVRDTGQGIPHDELDQIFQPFRQMSTRSTADEKGSGLGLAICRKVIEEHDGTIRVESRPGEGTVFFIRLPCLQEEPRSRHGRARDASARDSK